MKLQPYECNDNTKIRAGDVVRWQGRGLNSLNIGIVESYCKLQDLWLIRFPDGRFEIEAWGLELISESR